MPNKEPNLYKRGQYWVVKIERYGQRVHESTRETSVHAARKYRDRALEKLKRIGTGLDPDYLYDDAMIDFLTYADAHLKPASVKRYEVSARALHPFFTGKLLASIRKAEIMDAFQVRRKTVSASSANRDRSCLSAMFSLAVDRDKIEFNPVQRVKKFRESEPRTRTLTDKEVAAILPLLSGKVYDVTAFALVTGARIDEILSLRWRHIDLKNREVTFVDTKSGRDRVVPLTRAAIKTLASQIRRIDTDLVFYNEAGQKWSHTAIYKPFKSACDDAKVENVVFHDLRRTFATRKHRMEGVPLHILQKLLGHHSVTVTEKSYAFLFTEDLHEAMGTVVKSSQSKRIPGVNQKGLKLK